MARGLSLLIALMALCFQRLAFAASSISSSGASPQQNYKLHWDLPCAFTYTGGEPYAYEQYACDYIRAHDTEAPDDFNRRTLYNSDTTHPNGSWQQYQRAFLDHYSQESKAAYQKYQADMKQLMSSTDPQGSGLDAMDPYAKAQAIVGYRNTVTQKCSAIAQPFGGGPDYVQDCNERLQALDAAAHTAERALSGQQRAELESARQKTFVGAGVGGELSRTSQGVSGGSAAQQQQRLGGLFDNSANGASPQTQSQRGAVGVGGGEATAGALASSAGGLDMRAQAPPVPGSQYSTKLCDFKGLPMNADGGPAVQKGDAFQLYEPGGGAGHSATIVVIQDRSGQYKYVRQDGAPEERGLPVVYSSLDAAVGNNGPDGKMTAVYMPAKTLPNGQTSGEAMLENIRSGKDGGGMVPDALRTYADHAPFGIGKDTAQQGAAFFNWCSVQSAGNMQAAQEPGLVGGTKAVIYEVASFTPKTLEMAADWLH